MSIESRPSRFSNAADIADEEIVFQMGQDTISGAEEADVAAVMPPAKR
jgi:hypothetical protein